jgi:tetratricopeptide (TPR) repeat protein
MKRPLELVFSVFIVTVFVVSCGAPNNDFVYSTESTEALEQFNQGLAELDMLQVDNARVLFDSALEADPSFAMAHFYRAQTAVSGDEFRFHLAEAVKLMANATEAEQLAIMQMKANSEDKTGEARDHLVKLVTLLPESRRAHYLLGIFYFGQQEWANAENEFTTIINLDPEFAPVYNMLGYAYSNQMKYSEAIDALMKYSELRPDDPNPHDSMAEIYLYNGDHENSIMAYKASLNLDPSFNASYAGLGHNYCFTKDFEKASENYAMILTGAKSVADTNLYYFWTSVALVHEDKLDDAINILHEQIEFAKARGMVGTQGACRQQLAFLYLERGDYKKALAETKIERELAKDPKLQKAVAEGMVRNANAIEARVSALQGRTEDAMKHLENFRVSAEASKNEINVDNYHALTALVALSMEDYTKAIEHFAQANEQNMYQQYHYAKAFEGVGKVDEAKELYEKVANYNRNNFAYAFVRDEAMKMK